MKASFLKISSFILFFLVFTSQGAWGWGFFAHQLINRQAIFSLPPEMIDFFKAHLGELEARAVNPDMRRYVNEKEPPRHYIDLENYGDPDSIPMDWEEAVRIFGEDSLMRHGILPWNLKRLRHQLVRAFAERDHESIIRYAADIGHYIADAHVPLHTTKNYNGQLTGQKGIHGFWETRLPELFHQEYSYWVGRAEYIPVLDEWILLIISGSHQAVDSVLSIERELNESFRDKGKYVMEERKSQVVRAYSVAYSRAYHRRLRGMVERRLRESIKAVADFWYTCWVEAGQPDLISTPTR